MKKPNLNTIIANNLNKTAHIPNKGMSGLPNKKATVPFVSDQGYKNGLPPAGSHYRIPSDTLYNPTPYRIKATPNNGPSQWLEAYDTNSTQFPGADYVDEQHYDMGGYISDRAKATQFGQYANGGQLKPKPKYEEWIKTVNPDFISNDYNLRDAYNELPYKATKAWAKDPERNHLPDTYKLPNHPTFSNESKYYDSVTPGVGGYWGEGADNYIKNPNIGPPIPSAKWMSQYKTGGNSSWMLTNPNKISTYFPRMANGGQPCYDAQGNVIPCTETTYHHQKGTSGLNYDPVRTVSPYLTNNDIKKYTQAPASPSDVNFITNFAKFRKTFRNYGDDYNPTEVPYKGEKHWNINRFIIDPHLNVAMSDLNVDKSTPEERRASILADMYKYNMLQNPNHKGTAFRKAKRFVRNEIDPIMKGAFYNDFLVNSSGTPNFSMLDPINTFADENPLKSVHTWNKGITSNEDMKKLHSNYKPEEWNDDRVKNMSMDYLINYKKMSKKDAAKQWQTWTDEEISRKNTEEYLSKQPHIQRKKVASPKEWANLSDDDRFMREQDLPNEGESDLNEYQIGGWLEDALNTGKKYARKIGHAITHADPVNFLPFSDYMPANAKAFTRFAAANIGLGKGVPFVKKEDLTPNQIEAIKQAALNAQKRTGSSQGGVNYSDYGEGRGQVWNNKSTLLTDPVKVAQTSLGRFTYGINPNNSVKVSDKYNFNPSSTTNDQGIMGNMLHRFVDALDRGVPADDPRRNVNFDFYKGGGPVKPGTVTTQTTQPDDGVVGTFLRNVAAVKKVISPDSNKTPKETVKAVAKLNKDYVSKYGKDYVDLMEAYGLDPFSKEGIVKAQELSKANPKTRIVCTANGCSEIAVNAASAFGNNYNRGNAWDLGNLNNVVATNPAYANQIGKGILSDPTSFTAPANMFQAGAIIGLNRKNTSKDNVRATTTADANDSWDYANQTLYPGSRGNEHAGYMIDANTMLHGTGGHDGAPAYYMIDDDMSNGVSLPGNLNYQPVETIMPGSRATAATKGVINTIKGWFNRDGGQPCYDCGGWLSQYADEGLEVTTQTTRPPIEGDWKQYNRYQDSLNVYNMDKKWEKVLDNLKNKKITKQQIIGETTAFTQPFANQTRLQNAITNLAVKDKKGTFVLDKNVRLQPSDDPNGGAYNYYSAKYVEPVQPINKPRPRAKVVKKQLMATTNPVGQPQVVAQNQAPIAAAPVSQEYRGNGSPMYGPSNSLIGFMEGRNFIPATGKYTQGMNKPDVDMLANKEQLNKYIQGKVGQYALPVQRTGGWLDSHL